MTIYYEGNLIFDSGLVSDLGTFTVDFGPGVSTNLVIVMNEGGNDNFNTRWEYQATVYTGYLMAVFTEDTTKTTTPIKFAMPPFAGANNYITNIFTNATVLANGFEGGAVGNVYTPPAVVSGWEVIAGSVTTPIFSPAGPHWSSALHAAEGTIATNFATYRETTTP